MKSTEAHSVLGALIHTCKANDDQASPEGFRRAIELGLIVGIGSPRTTPVGRGVLRALGVSVASDE